MPPRHPPAPVEVEVVSSLAEVAAEEWDALVQPDDPFTEHAFLHALETSQSVGPGTGWQPVHLLARQGDTIVGAAPLYLKQHSYGEYIFDWGWAEACHRAGVAYYPKLTSAVPFTPATGRRLLTGPGPLDEKVALALISGMRAVCEATKAQSIHLLFITQEEHALLGQDPGLIGRVTHQFHWNNPGCTDFEDWLGRFRARRRKEVRRERRQACESGARIRVLRGTEMTEQEWRAVDRFYRDTVQRKRAQAYLSESFFHHARLLLGHRARIFLADQDGTPVAAALAFERGRHLYGRYWGCESGWERLHFELCYHRPIAHCIEHGLVHFEAGAQGFHKIQRGLMPAKTYSAHQLAHPGLGQAVRAAMIEEGARIQEEMVFLEGHGPFRRDADSSEPG
jgi:predicted N-acyltransferase